MLLDKGVVINADIAVSIGDTELLGVKIRAAVASFETAAQYGLEFPTGTDMERVEEAAGVSGLEADEDGEQVRLDDLGLEPAQEREERAIRGGPTESEESGEAEAEEAEREETAEAEESAEAETVEAASDDED